MIQSMTGYGKTVVAYKGKKINVENQYSPDAELL